MSAEENIETAKRAYEAFTAGDATRAMEAMAEDIEWIVPGQSAVSGTYHGREEVGAFWAQLAEKAFATSPQHFLADEERVVVLTRITMQGGQAEEVDVLRYRDGKLVRFQSATDTALLERVFGTR